MALVITDLDNTLYDWVSFFSPAFSAMVEELRDLTGVEEEILLKEFKAVHQNYGDSERPLAILDLPSVKRAFGDLPRAELAQRLSGPLSTFDEVRSRRLRLYASVEQTLAELQRRGHVVVGHTEAMLINSYYRLTSLGVARFFTRLYALEGQWEEPGDLEWEKTPRPPRGFARIIPREERKPNPELLKDICDREGFRVEEAVYVGDSLTRDISMAKTAGVYAVWARYGTRFDRQDWRVLVSVTHWTDEDVKQEEMLKEMFRDVQPDYAIDSFSELIGVIGRAGLGGRLPAPSGPTSKGG